MGLFGNAPDTATSSDSGVAYKLFWNQLPKKDGKLHTFMFRSNIDKNGVNLSAETDYNVALDGLICGMQDRGLEIVDIKFTVFSVDIGAMQGTRMIETLIMYK